MQTRTKADSDTWRNKKSKNKYISQLAAREKLFTEMITIWPERCTEKAKNTTNELKMNLPFFRLK